MTTFKLFQESQKNLKIKEGVESDFHDLNFKTMKDKT